MKLLYSIARTISSICQTISGVGFLKQKINNITSNITPRKDTSKVIRAEVLLSVSGEAGSYIAYIYSNNKKFFLVNHDNTPIKLKLMSLDKMIYESMTNVTINDIVKFKNVMKEYKLRIKRAVPAIENGKIVWRLPKEA